ncbi:MAG: hypothetical protein WCF22_17645 [Candidatus Sulfotelmatobacter sp.]
MPKRNQVAARRSGDILDRRAGYRLTPDWGHIAVLEGGGHICELGLKQVPGVNPLWKPQWTSIDPDGYSPARHRRVYGSPPDGKLLAGIAGHSLSFDHFGPPSKEETAAGLTTHGEAPSTRWKLSKVTGSPLTLRCSCTLREAQIDFSRTIAVHRTNAVIYCEEHAENLSCYDRPISWNEHVTFGPPFLECQTTIFDMPATQAKVCPPGYSKRIFLQPDAEFIWPEAPRKDGGRSNLRTTPDERFEHYTAQLLDPGLDIAFISACNPKQGLLVVYAFLRADFPWVGNWEERNNRTSAPWKGRTFCRGIEFSTTPFSVPRRETVDQGRLFGKQTYRWLPAKSSLTVRFLIMLFKVPQAFAGVKQLSIDHGLARVTEAGSQDRQLTVMVGDFL